MVVVNFEVEAGGKGEGGDSGRASLLAAAASSHAARAEGSIGHVVCGGSFEGVWIFVEEVLPMIMRLRSGQLYELPTCRQTDSIRKYRGPRPMFSRGIE